MSKVTSSLVKFWDDENVEIHNVHLRRSIPSLPMIKKSLQVVRGGFETLAFLALQVQKSQNKEVIVRSIASAVMILFRDTSKNYTGSPEPVVDITGLERIIEDGVEDRSEVLVTNFIDASPVSLSEMDSLMEVDPDEIGSYFGVLCLCAVKALTSKNRTAFNEKRQNAVRATTIGEPKIFVTDSPFLSDHVVQKVYASFNSYLPIRSHVVSTTVHRLGATEMGPTLAFATMFLLLVDQGMSALRIVKEALVKHPWIRTEFPEVQAEINVAQDALIEINKGDPAERSFLKAIHGAAFVPVSYASIANVTGLCKFVLKETTTTYAQYDGGKVTEAQEIKLTHIMMEKGLMRAVEAAAPIQE